MSIKQTRCDYQITSVLKFNDRRMWSLCTVKQVNNIKTPHKETDRENKLCTVYTKLYKTLNITSNLCNKNVMLSEVFSKINSTLQAEEYINSLAEKWGKSSKKFPNIEW